MWVGCCVILYQPSYADIVVSTQLGNFVVSFLVSPWNWKLCEILFKYFNIYFKYQMHCVDLISDLEVVSHELWKDTRIAYCTIYGHVFRALGYEEK